MLSAALLILISGRRRKTTRERCLGMDFCLTLRTPESDVTKASFNGGVTHVWFAGPWGSSSWHVQ
jgi:hypothetical protein